MSSKPTTASRFKVCITRDTSAVGLSYTLTVRSTQNPKAAVSWLGYGSQAACRRSLPAAEILVQGQLDAMARRAA
jgi:hypothetical protein